MILISSLLFFSPHVAFLSSHLLHFLLFFFFYITRIFHRILLFFSSFLSLPLPLSLFFLLPLSPSLSLSSSFSLSLRHFLSLFFFRSLLSPLFHYLTHSLSLTHSISSPLSPLLPKSCFSISLHLSLPLSPSSKSPSHLSLAARCLLSTASRAACSSSPNMT